MIGRIAGLMVLVASTLTIAAGSPQQLHTDQDCRSSQAYASSTHLLLVDRTTRANSSSDRRWRDALPAIIRRPTTTGMLVVMEPRDNATQSSLLGRGCLEPLPQVSTTDQRGYGSRLWSWVAGGAARFFGNDPEKASEAEKDAAADRVGDIVAHRSGDVRTLGPLVAQGVPTRHDTEIAEFVVNALASECSGRRLCRVYLYSDLLDSRAKALARNNRGNPDVAGRDRARQLIAEVRPDLRNAGLEIRNWGFGRSDVDPDQQLPELERRKLRAYWNGFFSELAAHARSGTYVIGDQYPS